MAAGGDSHWHYRVEVAHALHVGEGVGLEGGRRRNDAAGVDEQRAGATGSAVTLARAYVRRGGDVRVARDDNVCERGMQRAAEGEQKQRGHRASHRN